MAEFLKNVARRSKARSKTFSKNQDGATAIEFALVALPFFALIFAIIELAIIFFISSALNNATSEAGRLIRVGQFQDCGGGARFKELVCENMDQLGNCQANLRVDVISEPKFSDITIPDTTQLVDDGIVDGLNTKVADVGQFDEAPASTPVIIQSTFFYRLALPTQLTRLESSPGSNIRILKSTTAFQTEPFPPSSACPPSPDDED